MWTAYISLFAGEIMRLAYKFLNNVSSVNAFKVVDTRILTGGNPDNLYLQLVDQDQKDGDGFLRYVPSSTATMVAHFNYLDSNKCITRVPTKPFSSDDRSIWVIPVLPTDVIAPNSLTLVLTDGSNVYTVESLSDLRVKQIGTTTGGSGEYYA